MNWEKLRNIDRRVLYVLIIIVIALALIKPIGFAILPSEDTIKAYNAIDALPSGSVVYLGMEFGASGIPELMPQIQSIIRQGFRKDLKFVAGGLWTESGSLAEKAFSIVSDEFPGKQYGVDWVNIGYKPGGEVVLEKMVSSIYEACVGVDYYGNDLSSLPLMAQVPTLKDVNLIAVFCTGTPGEREYIRHVTSPYNVPIIAGLIAVNAPQAMPLVQAGQLITVLTGMKSGAEYEVLVGVPGLASAGMDAQSFTHALILVFIILGNLGYFLGGRKCRPKHSQSSRR